MKWMFVLYFTALRSCTWALMTFAMLNWRMSYLMSHWFIIMVLKNFILLVTCVWIKLFLKSPPIFNLNCIPFAFSFSHECFVRGREEKCEREIEQHWKVHFCVNLKRVFKSFWPCPVLHSCPITLFVERC